jgi:hypothetical protein
VDRVLIRSEPAREGWLPSWAGPVAGALHVDWCHFGESPLHEPFFEDSLARAMRQPVNQLLRHRTPIEALGALHARRPGLRPSGFVFHASRCGSTLVAQMLAALPDAVVLSEASPLDAVLRGAGDTRQRADWLVWMLSALGQARRPGDRRLFVKFDAWHARQLPLIRQAYPDTPWVYLYRDPREVLASQLRQPGAFLVPGLLASGTALESGSIAQRIGRMLSETGLAALAAMRSGGGMLLDYAQLPAAVPRELAHHFGLRLDATDSTTLLAVARFNAKTPALPFEPTTCSEGALSESDLRALEQAAMPVYRELERARTCALM